MLSYSRGPGVSQNLDGCFSALVFGSKQQKLSIVSKSCRVGFDHFVGETIIGQVGFKCSHDRVRVRFAMSRRFWSAPDDGGLTRRRSAGYALLGDDALVVNGIFKSCAPTA